MASTELCQYAKDCPIFQGKVKLINPPLPIYKNVFCNRGYKGWKNCKKYIDNEKFVKKLNSANY